MSGIIIVPAAEMCSLARALSQQPNVILPATPLIDVCPIGSGGYATVFSATLAADSASGHKGDRVALKLTAPASVWEFYVQRQLAQRAPSRAKPLFLPAHALIVGSERTQDGGKVAASQGAARRGLRVQEGSGEERAAGHAGILVLPLGRFGTLLDLVNAHLATGTAVADSLQLYLSLQLLQV